MQIIPVIDLLNGQVVHARAGERHHYRPLQSALCETAAPEAVIAALLRLYPFKILYVADLNAIQQQANDHYDLLLTLQQQFPQLTWWLDAGLRKAEDWEHWQLLPQTVPIIGSETVISVTKLMALSSTLKQEWILSLDFRGDVFLGNESLLQQIEYWPQHVIIMTLGHVGQQRGPDFKRLHQFRNDSVRTHFFCAGGVRNSSDLRQLQQMQISGALVATALHNRNLSAEQLHSLIKEGN